MISKQADQKTRHDQRSKLRCLLPGQSVIVRDFRHHNKWIPGVVLRKLGPVTYCVKVTNGKILKRHIDHLSKQLEPAIPTMSETDTPIADTYQFLDP